MQENRDEIIKNFIEKFRGKWIVEDSHKASPWDTFTYKDFENFSGKFYDILYTKDFFENIDEKSGMLKNPIVVKNYISCHNCGALMEYEVGNGYIKSITKCNAPGDYSFDINVPSGELLFCD